MAGGQMLDLEAETKTLGEADIVTLQAMKTGALIRFACEAGPLIAGASAADVTRLGDFGRKIGLAFQLADDLLDLTADTATLGKASGKDAAKGKGTLPALYGEAWTRKRLAELIDEAEALLSPYGEKAAVLKAAARFVAYRKN
jgi:farnesyl diphosphate synthase